MTTPLPLPPPPRLRLPSVDEVRARSALLRRRRRLIGGAASGAAVAAVLVLALGLIPESDARLQTRGATSAPHLDVRAAVVGTTGTRPLQKQASLADQLVFRVTVDQPGTLSIVEVRDGVVRPVLREGIAAGTYVPGGTTPLGWRTDSGPGNARYIVEHCVSDGPCSERSLEVRWEE